jgi:hypothetical protein
MREVFPILAGLAVGLVTHRAAALWMRAVLIAVLGAGFGALASWASGELTAGWLYLATDTAQVIGVAIMTAIVVIVWQRHQTGRPAR